MRPFQDFPKCDLLIIMGTSLVVHPFAGLVDEVNDDVPRLLINLTEAGRNMSSLFPYGGSSGLCYYDSNNYRFALVLLIERNNVDNSEIGTICFRKKFRLKLEQPAKICCIQLKS